MTETLVGSLVVGLVLVVWCSPRRDEYLWWLTPGWAMRLIAGVTGRRLVRVNWWSMRRREYHPEFVWKRD